MWMTVVCLGEQDLVGCKRIKLTLYTSLSLSFSPFPSQGVENSTDSLQTAGRFLRERRKVVVVSTLLNLIALLAI